MYKSALMLTVIMAVSTAGYAVPGPDSVELTRSATILGPAANPPNHLQVAVTVTAAAGVNVASSLTAFTIQESIPSDWNYVSVDASPEPAVAGPDPNTPTTLNFVWVTLPNLATPFTMTYYLTIPAGSTGGEITGQVLFRTTGGTLSSMPVTTSQDFFNCLLMARTAPAQYRAGDQVTVTVTLTSFCGSTSSQSLTALGIEETIPAGWSLVSVAGGVGDIQPSPGAQGTLEFGWTTPPATFPVSFSYVLSVPADASGNALFDGVVLSRLGSSDELTSPRAQTVINFVPTAVVPNVTGQTEANARSTVESLGLAVGSVSYRCDNTISAATVLEQQPAPGTRLDLPAQVDLVVSSGPCPVNVPNVIGQGISSALTAIQQAGFQIGTVNQECSNIYPSTGTVIGQNPAGNTTAPYGSTINLVLSSGPCPVTVPDVTNKPVATARQEITDAGLIVGQETEACSNTVPAGNVIRTDPAAGAQVDPGTVVHLVVSTGPCPAQVTVPDVTGQSQTAAAAAIQAAGLVVGQQSEDCSDSVPAGNVIRTDPAAGAQVNPGTVVNLVVSTGPCTAPVSVPDVVGMQVVNAISALHTAGLIYTTIEVCNENTPVGVVINQLPSGGTSVSVGSTVTLTVSTGPCDAIVPDVVGMTLQAAQTALSVYNFTVDIFEACSNTVPAGSVVSQNPVGGTPASAGITVNLVISSGPCPVTVPDVSGLTQAAAEAVITAANLYVGQVTESCSNTVLAGSVIRTDPAAGMQVNSGTVVHLVVSNGPCSVTVPDVTKKPVDIARQEITDAGLTVGQETEACSDTEPAGNVISSDPAAGTTVQPGAVVHLVVSSGPCPVTVPEVVGQAQSDAAAAIQGASLTVGTVGTQCSDSVPAGQVISQSPAAGASVQPGSAVNLVVSAGPAVVPNVVGQGQSAAAAAIEGAGLTVGAVQQVYSTSVTAGLVIRQNPVAGTILPCGGSVNLLVSLGKPDTTPTNREIMQQILDRFDAVDTNGDNQLSLEEILAGSLQNLTLEIFQTIDTNNDGALTREELENYLKIGGCFGCVRRLFIKDLLVSSGGDLLMSGLGLALLLLTLQRRSYR